MIVIVNADLENERLDVFLTRTVEGLTRSSAQKMMDEGLVTVGGKPGKKNTRLNPGDEVHI